LHLIRALDHLERSFPMGREAVLCVIAALVGSGGLIARADGQTSGQATKTAEAPAGLLEALKDKDPSIRLQAAQALVQLGQAKAALPVVQELLKAPQPAIRLEAGLLLKQMGPARFAAQLKDADPSARLQAAQALWQMGGAEAKSAIPVLVELLKSPRPELRFRAALILTGRSVPEAKTAVGVLIEGLKDPHARVRLQAAQRFLQIGAPEARDVAPTLVDLLRHHQRELGFQPAMLLGQMRPADLRSAAPALLEGLNDRNPGIRFQSALVLARIGRAETEAAIPVLINLLGADKNPPRQPEQTPAPRAYAEGSTSFRLQAAQALMKLGPEAKAAIPPLVKLLDDPQAALFAALALRQIGPEAVQPVLETWSKQDSFNRPGVIRALAQFGPKAKPATPKLIEALTSQDTRVREQAAIALRQIGTDAVPSLANTLTEPDPRLRRTAAAILAEIGPAAECAIPTLTQTLRDPDGSVRVQAAQALWEVEHSAEKVIPVLLNGLQEKNVMLRRSSARLLAEIAGVPQESIPALRAALKDQDLVVRVNAAVCLCGIHPKPLRRPGRSQVHQASAPPEQVKEAVAVLLPALKNKGLRNQAVEALAKAGPEAKDAIPALLGELEDDKEDYAFAGRIGSAVGQILGAEGAETLLRGLDSAPKRLRPLFVQALGQAGAAGSMTLLKFIDDGDSTVRVVAVRSLGQAGWQTAETVPALIKALRDSNAQVRREGIRALGRIGRGAKGVASAPEAVSALTQILKGGQAEERILAAETLGYVQPSSQQAVSVLVEMAQSDGLGLRRQAIAALGRIAEHRVQAIEGGTLDTLEKAAIPALAESIDSWDATLRLEAAFALAQMEASPHFAFGAPLSEKVLSVLLEVVRERNHPMRTRAMEALSRCGAGGEEVVAALTRALGDGGPPRVKAAESLGRLGPPAKSAVPILADLLKEPDAETRIQAALALWRIDHQAEVVPVLVRELKSSVARRPTSASPLSGRLGVAGSTAAVPPCRQAADALGIMGPAARAAVPALIEVLRNPRLCSHRPSYAQALAKIDRQAAGVAVPMLIDLLDSKPEDLRLSEQAAAALRRQAAKALGEIGAPARDAVPSLRKALSDPDDGARADAAAALKKLGG
jgi:HEAT repeat protein